MDYTGIENVNEYYTQHYLSAIMEAELAQEVFPKWREQERLTTDSGSPFVAPDRAVGALWQSFFRLRDAISQVDTDALAQLHEIAASVFDALHYPVRQGHVVDIQGAPLPLMVDVRRHDGSPLVWGIAVMNSPKSQVDLLSATLHPGQFAQLDRIAHQIEPAALASWCELTMEEVVGQHVFNLEEPPRFVLLVDATHVALLDRTKWFEKRMLRFDLSEILGRREAQTIRAAAALLCQASLAPHAGSVLLDTLDDSSHRHAYGVSEDLKYALRQSIELLGNEAIHHLRYVAKTGVFNYDESNPDDLGTQLGRECLRYMYRLLFLFYIEARPELGYAPMNSPMYMRGYSLEVLRELELVELRTDESRDGTFFHTSLDTLFSLIFQGIEVHDQTDLIGEMATHHGFLLPPLKASLFDPQKIPLLRKVKFRNVVLQQVVELMSLSRAKGRQQRGRISYAQLGINQLGAVYESLLSYRGFFAKEDLYEVTPSLKDYSELETAYFVSYEELTTRSYTKKEIVRDASGDFVKHEKGKFLYRLAGRDRQRSASYYTPEVLTKCLVKYTLKALLEDEDGQITRTPDEILRLTVCEPAMGSAAFLNEAVNQLSEIYLRERQKEAIARGDRPIPHEDYAREKQKVKMYFADNNVFGVDLNPVAVELAEVSLWLNTIHQGAYVPWFGMQLLPGNSLVGCRREVFTPAQTKPQTHTVPGKKAKKVTTTDPTPWLTATPTRIPLPQPRPESAIYHFLLGDEGMAAYNDDVIKGKGGKNPTPGIAPEEVATMAQWRKAFNAPLSETERTQLVMLSHAIDDLWQAHVEMQQSMRTRTTDPIDIYGHSLPGGSERITTTREKDAIWHGEQHSYNSRASSPYRRLKLAMDYWCALWFWPILRAEDLPTREEFIAELGLILEVSNIFSVSPTDDQGQQNLFSPTMSKERAKTLKDRFGVVDIEHLSGILPRFTLVAQLAAQHRFFHWELEFADVFATRGGFDVVLGNPPWLKVKWDEKGVMGDRDPHFVLKKLSANQAAKERERMLQQPGFKDLYLEEYESASATKSYLNALQNYPDLKGIQTNLYKCFLPKSWFVLREQGTAGLLHPEGVYDDSKGGAFREQVYVRLQYHFQFINEMKLFEGIGHSKKFSINVFDLNNGSGFVHMSNLYLPSTIEASFGHNGEGPVPGIKDDDNNWNIEGHRQRIIQVDKKRLALFASLYDTNDTPPEHARLPALHSEELVSVLEKFAVQPRRLADLTDNYHALEMWHETNTQKDGTIRRDTKFPDSPEEWILSGPHFFVGTLLNKTPRAECTQSSHYDVIDTARARTSACLAFRRISKCA